MYEKVEIELRGRLMTIQHNPRLLNPLDKWSKLIKTVSSKQSKQRTDEDYMNMFEWEFKGSLYLEDDKKDSGRDPIWPGVNIEAMIRTAAKKDSKGKQVQKGVLIQENPRLIYDGPKTRDELWEDERFRLIVPAKASGRIMRSRPRFNPWSIKFSLQFVPSEIALDYLRHCIEYAGKYIGLTDWKHRTGLFELVKFHTSYKPPTRKP